MEGDILTTELGELVLRLPQEMLGHIMEDLELVEQVLEIVIVQVAEQVLKVYVQAEALPEQYREDPAGEVAARVGAREEQAESGLPLELMALVAV
jgi:hypothetical protein